MRSVVVLLLAVVVIAGCSAGKNAPKVDWRIDDLSTPAAELLRQLPGVVEVEVLVAPPNPTHRIIQLRDWHYVPPDLFAVEVRQVTGKPLSDDEVDALYREALLEIELVQVEQTALLLVLRRVAERMGNAGVEVVQR